jgi:hypothetical protein
MISARRGLQSSSHLWGGGRGLHLAIYSKVQKYLEKDVKSVPLYENIITVPMK